MSRRGPYIVSRRYDWAFFLAPPAVALLIGALIGGNRFANAPLRVGVEDTTLAGFAIGILIHAHLVAVFFRSHGNPSILRRHPVRFLVVPPLVWLAIVASPWIAVLASVIATFWDVWHSGAQTFGFGRIYDRNAGFPVEVGRRMDFWMNQLLYAGPILAGATLMDHLVVLEEFETFEDALSNFLIVAPADIGRNQRWLTIAVVGLGTLFVIAYVAFYVRLARKGLRPSWLKVFLLASTGLCSIYTWGFDSFGEAFFIMNLFHAVQYLALVWATEGPRLTARLRTRRPLVGLVVFLGLALAYGAGVELIDPAWSALWALTIVVSLMHFWYDAFIWSVQREQV